MLLVVLATLFPLATATAGEPTSYTDVSHLHVRRNGVLNHTI